MDSSRVRSCCSQCASGQSDRQVQADLGQGRFDNGLLNDVIDSLRKSANTNGCLLADRDVLNDDVNRLHDYQRNHNHWTR